MNGYRAVYQTWNLVRSRAPPTLDMGEASQSNSSSQNDGKRGPVHLRLRVQTARIERRWSIADLAAQVQCDPSTLAAFERGDEVLTFELQQRLRRILPL